MNKFFRWQTRVILTVLVLMTISATFTIAHSGISTTVHAAGNNPTISMPAIVHPFDVVTITGQGFNANDSVQVYVDNTYNYPITNLSCDVNGNCSGQTTIPYSNVAQGVHQVIATDNNGLTAQMAVTFLPGIAAFISGTNLTSAGPGGTIELRGGSFTLDEPIKIYWGAKLNILEGSYTTGYYDGSIDFTFKAPIAAQPGNYPITVVRSQQTPASVTTLFTILPPKIVTSAGIRNSQAAHIQLSGFAVNETVTLSWNANSGQTITTFNMDQTGAFDSYFAPPFAPKGSYILQAIGNDSLRHAQRNLNIGPGILLSLNTENPGGTTTANGGGFTPGETVNVYFQDTSNGITTATVDSSGSFSVPLTVPVSHNKNASYFVYAVSTTTTDSANAQFFYATPSIQLGCCNSPTYGNSFTLNGQGYAALETVTISAQNIAQKYPVKLGTATAAADGTFSFTSTMPGAPYTTIGVPTPSNMMLIALGSTSKAKASELLFVRSNIIPAPGSGKIGQKIQLSGGGFASGETVTISMINTQVATATTDTNGSFHTTFVVPTTAQPGNYFCDLCAIGSTSGQSVNVGFIVLPSVTITPKKGPSGTTITVSGNGYFSYDTVWIYWYDPGTNTQTLLTSVNTTSNACQTTITAPSNLTTGTTYDVVVQDADNVGTIQLPFLAK
jgi:hypothetical protein